MEAGISVIIPIYNADKYLCQCIDSVINQKFQNIQVILVDDGSNDDSAAICDKYAALHRDITVIHQKNAGVSSARNAGIEVVRKEYLYFLDADDYLSDNALEIQYSRIKDVDLVITGTHVVSNDVLESVPIKSVYDDIRTAKEMLYYLFEEDEYGYQGYITNKLFRTDIIKRNQISFDSLIKYNEDRLFLLEYLLKCKIINITSDITYYYRRHENSALGKIEKEFHNSMLTELDAFEKMKILVQDKDRMLFEIISRIAFEKCLYWLKKIPASNSKKKVRTYLYNNAKVCWRIPGKGLRYKVKLIFHCILER